MRRFARVRALCQSPHFVVGVAVLWCVVIAVVQWVRYQQFGFPAFDLSIYTQLLWNISHGNGAFTSVQGHHYFADHFEPLVFLIAPLLRIWASPLILLWFQTLCIGLSVFPLRQIVRRVVGDQWVNGMLLLFFLHPVVWNIALFEFHIIALALPLFLFAIAAYMERRFATYLCLLVVAAFVREDIGLVVIGLGLLAALQKRSVKWWASPAIIGGLGLLTAFLVQSSLRDVGLTHDYLPWLDAFAAGNLQTGFMLIGDALLRWDPYRMVAIGTLAFGGVVALGWKWWVPVVPVVLLFALTNRAIGDILVSDHHAAVTTAFLFVAMLVGAQRAASALNHSEKWKSFGVTPAVAFTVVGAIALSPWIFIWGVRPAVPAHVVNADISQLVQRIDENDGVLASANLLPHVAARETAQLTWYVFKQRDELNQNIYTVDPSVEWVLFDSEEFLDFRTTAEYRSEYETAFQTLLREQFTVVDTVGSAMLWRRNGMEGSEAPFESIVQLTPGDSGVTEDKSDAVFELVGAPKLSGAVLEIAVAVLDPEQWRVMDAQQQQLLFRISAGEEEVRVPLGYGFATPDTVQPGDIITTHITLPERLLSIGGDVRVVGLHVQPERIVRGRYQSTVREDHILAKVFKPIELRH